MRPDDDALRQRAAAALESALGFALANGDAWTRLRAEVAVDARPVADLQAALASRQRPDGALPSVEDVGHDLDGTLDGLMALGDARALTGPVAEAAMRWLGSSQRRDGSWGDGGPPESRIVATGFAAGLLGRTRFARADTLERAGAFLGPLFSPERVAGTAWPALAAFASFFSNVRHDLADEALQWCGRELERGFRTGAHDAVHVVRILLLCDSSALPGARLHPAELVEALLGEQARDGGFAQQGPAGPRARAPHTVTGMLGLIRLCRALRPVC